MTIKNKETLRPIPYAARRQHFLSEISKDGANAVAIVPAHPELIRNHDVHYKFRQDSTFQYLTGFEEPDSIAVFLNINGKKEFVLFVRPKDLEKEIWTGFRAGVDGAVNKHGADRAYPLSEFDTVLPKLLQGADRIYYSFFRTLNQNGVEYLDQKVMRLLENYRQSLGRSGRGLVPIHDTQEVVGEMRIYKAPEEVDRLRMAGKITAKAHSEIMARVRPGMHEYQIEALFEYIAMSEGCMRHGYPSIVAGGANATILHYVENNKELKAGDLLLVDAGGEFDYYTADITRTFPIDGKMNPAQREIYDITLRIQKECVRMARPGATLALIHEFAVEQLTDAMVTLKFLSGDRKRLVETLAYKRYYPHGTGHLLGMDVHDIGLYKMGGEPRRLEPGMCFTIEPGFYVLEADNTVPEKYRGIGIRIEDDILITAEGCENLTAGVPKEVDEMAALIGSKEPITF